MKKKKLLRTRMLKVKKEVMWCPKCQQSTLVINPTIKVNGEIYAVYNFRLHRVFQGKG